MKLNPIGPNQNEVTLPNGTQILFSYSTPVAAYVPGRGWLRTSTKHSVTTSRHINQWLDGIKAESVPQAEIDALNG